MFRSFKISGYLILAISIFFLSLFVNTSFVFSDQIRTISSEKVAGVNVCKAGLPDVPGVMFLKKDGRPGGFAAEILDNAARDEGIELEWVFAPWPELFGKLKSGEIDVLPGVTVSPERREYLDYIENNLYVTWSELFIGEDSSFRSITDLANKRIGLVDRDYNSEGFIKYISGFGLSYISVSFSSHKDAVEALKRGDIFAVVGPMSLIMTKNYPGLKSSGIFFSPSDSSIAFPKGKNEGLRISLDKRIGIYKVTPDSVYVRLFKEYGLSDFKHERSYVPDWILYILGFAFFSAFGAILFNFLLRHQVNRKKIELERSEGKLNYAAELARLGYWEMDHKTGVTTWSTHLRQILEADFEGRERKEDEILEFIHPDDREYVLACFNESLVPGGKYLVQHRVVTGAGNVLWLDEIGHTEFSSSGEPLYTFGVSIDVTEKLKSQEEIRRSQERFKAIFDGIDESVMVHSPDTLRIVHANMAAFRMYGFASDELSVLTMMDLSSEVCSENMLRQKIDACSDAGGVLFEWMAKKKNGSNFPVEIALRTVETDGGINFVSVIRDISQRKMAEDELKTKEEMLRQAQKMEALGQLAGGIAHDFNNMLFGIMGYAEILQRKVGCERLAGYCQQIIYTSQRAADLTKQLLSFARKGSEYKMPVDVHGCIASTFSMLSRTVDRSIILKKSLFAENYFVIGDPSQLQSAFLNLGLNARDAMPDGGVLEIATEEVFISETNRMLSSIDVSQGRYLCIRVSDTGKGILPEYQPKIFEPFFTTKKLGQGTGLGLAAVYGTITGHGGAITVSSTEGKGTVFEIHLPITEAMPVNFNSAPINQSLPSGVGTVLVADDEPVIRDMIRIILAEIGYGVISAENGQQAVEIFSSRHKEIDLVILDVIMPEMGGVEAYEKIKSINSGVRVIIISGFATGDKSSYFMDKDIVAFLKKPCSYSQLAETISKALK